MDNSPELVVVDGKILSDRNRMVYEYTMKRIPHVQSSPFYWLIHGPAGTGKSLLLKAIRNGVQKHFGDPHSCIVTAPTAIGSESLSAHTLNSTFITWDDVLLRHFLASANEQQLTHMSWMKNSKVILIDIINFVGPKQLATISHRLQEITGVMKPFGGLSVIVFGDFYQLPPIEGKMIFEGLNGTFLQKHITMCPTSPENLWSLFHIIELFTNIRTLYHGGQSEMLESMRQNADEEDVYYDYLNRNCFLCWDKDQSLSEIVEKFLQKRDDRPDYNLAVLTVSTEISNHINRMIVQSDPTFVAFEHLPSANLARPKRGNKADMDLFIAVDCPVILTCNINELDLKNGSIGNVMGFDFATITVRFHNKLVQLQRTNWIGEDGHRWRQFPIRVAYSHTIERSQGMEFDGIILVRNRTWKKAEINTWMEEHEDNPGVLYTALSRTRNIKNCVVTPLRNLWFGVSPKVRDELKRLIRDCHA